jgi:DNA-directed RNA polymerase specialized sigma24 family protein
MAANRRFSKASKSRRTPAGFPISYKMAQTAGICRYIMRESIIGNLRAYATRAISRALNKAEKAQKKKDALISFGDMETTADFSQNDKIENEILVRELLDTFTPQDREIFLRRMNGDTFPDIDSEMNLKPRTAEQRFRVCKGALRQALQDKLNRRACSRGR